MSVEAQPSPPVEPTPDPAAAAEPQIPWLSFPPFPEPPPGVSVIPFTEFKPSGLYMRMEDEDSPEVDPLGIPTVTLGVKHSLTEEEQARKKKKKKTVYRAGGVIKRVLWFEEWEDGENLRRSVVNPLASRVDRLHQACQDFKNPANRTWPSPTSGVPQLWDAFRLYIGIIAKIYPAMSKKKQAQLAEDEMDEDDEGEDDEVKGGAKSHQVEMVDNPDEVRERNIQQRLKEAEERRKNFDEAAKQRYERRGELKEERMAYFFDDPELAMKEFFSAHYRDKGLIWDKPRCRDGPILVEYFLKYLLRSNALPEYEKGLRRAVEVVKLAQKELPLTFVVGETLPDPFSLGCEKLFGGMTGGMFTWGEDETAEDKDTKKDKPDEEEAKRSQQELADFVASNAKASVQIIDPNDPSFGLGQKLQQEAVADNVDINGVETAPTSGWGIPSSGWGGGWNDAPTGNSGPPPGDWGSAGGWGAPEPDDNNAAKGWFPERQSSLIDLLGPTVFPFTHTTGIIERSTRRILKVVRPPPPHPIAKKKSKGKSTAELVEEELENRLGYIVLGPWKKIGNDVRSDVTAPSILPDSRGPTTHDESVASTEASSTHIHNPEKDEIIILIDPKTVETVQPAIGLGLLATWVQIKKGGPGVNGEPTKWWYMEQLMASIPSYHTDRHYENQA
ncbi:unnamed protein product [Somion occarium]|uniref:Uncharacterized protein n=1 Tax=Somion occarium TaxID=3059160 RepID=A0ABP1CZI6_9APHY